MAIFSRKKPKKDETTFDSKTKGTKETFDHSSRHALADELARQMAMQLQSEANKSNDSTPVDSRAVVKSNTQPNIIDMLQHIDRRFLLGIVFFFALSAVINVIVSLVTSIVLLAVISVLFTPLTEQIVQEMQVLQDILEEPKNEGFMQRLRRSIRPKTQEEIRREQTRKTIKEIKKVLQSDF